LDRDNAAQVSLGCPDQSYVEWDDGCGYENHALLQDDESMVDAEISLADFNTSGEA
jgi:hypothetical protein